MKPNSEQPLWVLGPSHNLHSYKDFIPNSLPRENVLTQANVFFYLKMLWDYAPMFFTWVDPHQTYVLKEAFSEISPKINKKSFYITYPFNKDMGDGKLVETFYKHFRSSGYRKSFGKYIQLQSLLSSHPLLEEEFCDMTTLNAQSPEVASRLHKDPNFRFNEFKQATYGVKVNLLENWITRLVFPFCQHYQIKTVFVLGFDDQAKRFYKKGSTGHLHALHSKYQGLNKWLEWFPYHGIKMYNLQSSSPLSKHLETIDPQKSLEFLK